jgi:sugar phosphate isomerase/epimerase
MAMNKLGLSSCELFELHVAPADVFPVRERLMQWRNSVPSSHFEMVREKFSKHKINIQSYAANFKDNVTDEELDSIFKNTRVLGTDILTTSATVSVMKRVDVFAKKYQVRVGMHNHDHTERPNEFSTPETFARGMSGNSEYIMINLDIGHATSANYDPLAYLKTIHDKVVCIHVKDRKKDHGSRTRFGEGDTPIAEVLRTIRDNKWNIPANIEFEYKGDTMEEMKRCVEYCRNVLENK